MLKLRLITLTGLLFLAFMFYANTDSLAESASGGEGQAQAIWDFAQHLYRQGDYYRAITEYERLLFFYPQHALSPQARLQIGLCYMGGEHWQEAIDYFLTLKQLNLPENIRQLVLYNLAESYYAINNNANARQTLRDLIAEFPDSPVTNQAYYLLGRTYLKNGMWEEAAREFARIRQGLDTQQLERETLKGKDLPYKSPSLAGGLSAALPGLGQLYAGQKQDAAVAFILNGLFIWGAVESFQRKQWAVGGIVAFFETGWYGGNIYSAMGSAHKYNRRLEEDFHRDILSRFKLSLGAKGANPTQPWVTLNFAF